MEYAMVATGSERLRVLCVSFAPVALKIFLNRKGVAAAAGRGGVRVLDLKRGAHQVLDKIDLGPVQQFERYVVDNHPDAAMFEHDIVGIALFVKAQPVLKARA